MSHTGGVASTYNISQQNGTAAVGGDGGRSARAAQYRRQGSSYGPGHVHNMAVMVPPTRVDYSVTKGGLRSWIVLIVFVLLCSTMLTIFSEDGIDSDNDDDTYSSVPEAAEYSQGEVRDVDDVPVYHSDIPVSIEPDEDDNNDNQDRDDDDDEEKEDAARLEAAMLAKLKEKATQREKQRQSHKIQTMEKEDEEDDDDSKEDEDDKDDDKDEQKHMVEAKVKENAKNAEEKQEENEEDFMDGDEDDDDDDDISEQELLLKRKKKASKRHKRREQRETQTHLKSWRDSSIQAQRLADDVKNPRKNLLKLKKTTKHKTVTETHDDNDDDEEEKDEEEVEQNENEEEHASFTKVEDMPVFEIVAPNKRPPAYDRKAITNRDDFKVRAELDEADFRLEKHKFAASLAIYERILRRNPDSPRALYGKAYALQLQSEFDDTASRSGSSHVESAILLYQRVLDNDDTPDELFRMAADNLAECARWIGNLHKVLTVQRALIDKFPEKIGLQNDFAITFLQMGRVEDARKVFANVLESDPTNSIAQAYYGYIFKVHYGDLEKGVLWMKKGLRSSHGDIYDPKFFFHLGDALTRLGRDQEASKIYEEAVSLGLFPSIYQRSLHNIDGLTARPWWTLDQTGCGKQLRHIERQWTVIREEALNAWERKRSLFHNEDNPTLDGVEMVVYLRKEWKFSKSECRTDFHNTCEVLKKLVEESSCGKDEIKISVLYAGSRIWPHCAPTNYELEAQLGLVTPSEARIRVGQTTRGWKSGQFIVFDKSFEHETWFDGAAANALRIVLSIDLWHPQVPKEIRMHSNSTLRRL